MGVPASDAEGWTSKEIVTGSGPLESEPHALIAYVAAIKTVA